MRFLLSLLLFGLAATSAPAGAKATPPDELARRVAPFVDDMTILVVHADVERLDIPAIFKLLEQLGFGDQAKEAGAGVAQMRDGLKLLGVRDAFVLLNWDAPRLDKDFLIVLPLSESSPAKGLASLLDKARPLESRLAHDAVILSTARNFERRKSFKPSPRPSLVEAFRAFEDMEAKAIVLPPPVLVRTLGEFFPKLPDELGGGDTRELGRALAFAGIGLRTADGPQARFLVQARDAKIAQKYQDLLRKTLDIPLHEPNLQLIFPQFAKIRDKLVPQVKGDQLVLDVNDALLREALGPAVLKAKSSAARAQSVNNLKQIGIAFHNYHDTHKTFPPAFTTTRGRRLLSWRVYLLPYLEGDHLFKQFHLDEPWDSDHNKKLIDKMPAVYRSPLYPHLPAGKTTYVVATGAKTIFPDGEGLGIRKITDGTSNTILTIEANAKKAVIWTAPDDLPFDEKELPAVLVHPELKGFNALFADGSVRWISGAIKLDTLRALLTSAGGEAASPD